MKRGEGTISESANKASLQREEQSNSGEKEKEGKTPLCRQPDRTIVFVRRGVRRKNEGSCHAARLKERDVQPSRRGKEKRAGK